MKKKLFTAALFSCSLFFNSCDQFAAERTLGESIPATEYKTYFASLEDNTEQEGKRISYEGYIDISGDIEPQDIPGLGSNLYLVLVRTEPLGEGVPILPLPAPFGDSKNNISVPTEFTDEDIVIITNDGEKLAYNEKVKISGTVTYPKKEGSYNSSTKKREYDFLLKDIRFDRAAAE